MPNHPKKQSSSPVSPSSSTAPHPAEKKDPNLHDHSSTESLVNSLYEPYIFPDVKWNTSLRSLPYHMFRFVCCLIYIFLTAISANVALIISFPVYLISPMYGAKMASFGIGWSCWILWCLFIESNLQVEFYGDELGSFENSVCIANHVSSADFILVLSMALRGRMLGNVKYFAKSSLSHIPLVGWGMRMLGMIFLKRNWMRDQKTIQSTFKYLRENHIPVWIVSFLEGTRVTEDKMKQSIKFQVERGLPVTTQVMAPRVKGLISTLQGLPDLEYIYDFTFAYATGVFSCTSLLWQAHQEGSRMCVYVNKIRVKDLPLHDEEKLKEFIYDLYVKKDQILKAMKEDKDGKMRFPGKARIWPLDVQNWWTVPFERSQKRNEMDMEAKKEQ